MTDEQNNKSLADRMREKKAAEEAAKQAPEGLSLADKLKAQKAASAPPQSLADKMRAQQQGENPSLADNLEASQQPAQSLKDKLQNKEQVDLAPEEVQALEAEIASLNTKYNDLSSRVKLTSIVHDTTRLGATIQALPAEVAGIRERGYAFRSYLENKVSVLSSQWETMNQTITGWIETESQPLQQKLAQIENLLDQISSATAATTKKNLVGQALSNIAHLESAVETSEQHVEKLYSDLYREVNQTNKQIKEINWIVEQTSEATFSLGPTENVFLAAEAEWDDGDDKPEGLLYLTDKRLIFEQKEKVGKKFGMFGGKDVHEVLWESPIASITAVESEHKGFLGGKDLIHLTLGSGSKYGSITVEVKGNADSTFWGKQINRMVNGNINDERAIEPDPELLERVRKAPTDCQVCGAQLQQATANELRLECQYCGAVINL